MIHHFGPRILNSKLKKFTEITEFAYKKSVNNKVSLFSCFCLITSVRWTYPQNRTCQRSLKSRPSCLFIILCIIIMICFSFLSLYPFISFFSTFPILSGREESTSGQLFVVKFGKSKQKWINFFYSKDFCLFFWPPEQVCFCAPWTINKNTFFSGQKI